MGASAAVAAGLAMPAATLPAVPVDEPLLEMERQWFAWRDYCCSDHLDESDEALDPLYNRLNEMERQLYLTPAQTTRGVLVKLGLWLGYYAGCSFEYPQGERWWGGDLSGMGLSATGAASIMQDLDRLAVDFERQIGGMRP